MNAERANGARRVIRLQFMLQGHTFDGLRLTQIAQAMQTSASTTLRDLQILEDEGVAERIPGRDEYWRLSPRIVQIATAHRMELARLQQRLDELDQRYTRDPN